MTDKQITELTPEQKVQLEEYYELWLKNGYSTAPLDNEQALKSIYEIYDLIDQKKPSVFFCQSPLQMCLLAQLLDKSFMHKLPKDMQKEFKSQIDLLDKGQKAEFTEDQQERLRSFVRDNRKELLEDEKFKQKASNDIYNISTFQWSSYWLAFYSFPEKYIPGFTYTAEESKKLNTWVRAAFTVPAFFPFEGMCFVSERPTQLHVDDNGRLHNETGPSLAWSDGSKLYSHHNIDIAPKLIEAPETITLKEIEDERNAEIKRIMMEKYGWGRFIIDSGAKVVDKYNDQLGNPVTLYEKDLGRDFTDPLKMVELTNSTPEDNGKGQMVLKKYMFRVPPTIKTAKAAHVWHCGFDPEKFDEIQFVEQT